jgi:hypothetical protein
MRNNKEFWLNLLIDADLTYISGQEFNKTGDSFLAGLEAATTPEEVAGVLAFHLTAPVAPATVPAVVNINLNFEINGRELADPENAATLVDFINKFKEKLGETPEE